MSLPIRFPDAIHSAADKDQHSRSQREQAKHRMAFAETDIEERDKAHHNELDPQDNISDAPGDVRLPIGKDEERPRRDSQKRLDRVTSAKAETGQRNQSSHDQPHTQKDIPPFLHLLSSVYNAYQSVH